MAIYPVTLEGFENQTIEVQDGLIFGSHKLLVDGNPAPKGKEKGEVVLTRDDGREVTARWMKSTLRKHILDVDGKTVEIKRSSLLWEIVLLAVPVGLWKTGVLGLIFAIVAIGLGTAALQTRRPPLQRFLLWAGAMVVAFGLNVVIGGLLTGLIR